MGAAILDTSVRQLDYMLGREGDAEHIHGARETGREREGGR